jgi:hypothetical protein
MTSEKNSQRKKPLSEEQLCSWFLRASFKLKLATYINGVGAGVDKRPPNCCGKGKLL